MKVLFISGSDHLRPRYFVSAMKSVNADLWISKFNAGGYDSNTLQRALAVIRAALTLPKGYDIYVSETVFIIPVVAKMLGRLGNAKIINITADPVMYDLVYAKNPSMSELLQKKLLDKVDGYIINGRWGFLLKKLGINKPYIEIPAATRDSFYNILIKIPIKGKGINHDLLFAGELRANRLKYKGIDLVLEAMELLKNDYPDIKLYCTGSSNYESPFIINTGFKKSDEDYAKVFHNKAICVNPGRGDTYPLGTIESMQAGIPALVSVDTGTKEIVSRAYPPFVTELDANQVADQIRAFFELSPEKRTVLSQKFRNAAKHLRESEAIPLFKKKWMSLIRRVAD